MGRYDSLIPGNEKKTSTTTQNRYSALIPAKKQSLFSTAKGIIASGKSFIKSVATPTPESLEYERQVLPDYYRGDSKIIKGLTAPGTAIARGAQKTFSRVLLPGLSPLAKDVAEIREVSKKNGIADKVSRGELPPEVLDDFEVLKKGGVEIVGDVAQAVLSLYGGKVATNLATESLKSPLKAAIKRGAREGLEVGALFGTAEVASDRSDTVKENLKRIGVSAVTGGIIGGIFSGAIPATKPIRRKIDAYVRKNQFDKLTPNQKADLIRLPAKDNVPKRIGVDFSTKENDIPINPAYIPESEMPVIDYGSGKPKAPKEPSVKFGSEPDIYSGDFQDITYEPNIVKSIINEGKNSPEVRARVDSDASIIKETAAKEKIATQEKEVAVEKIATSIEKNDSNITEFQHQTNKGQVEKVLEKDFDEIKEIAMGRKPSPDEVPREAYFATLKNIADEQALAGDTSLAIELSLSDVGRKSGQNLQSLNIAAQDNIVDVLTDIRTKIEDRMPNRSKRAKTREVNTMYNDLKKSFKDLGNQKVDKTTILKAIDKITCK